MTKIFRQLNFLKCRYAVHFDLYQVFFVDSLIFQATGTDQPNIKILLSIDSSAFPVGTGPKHTEIWRSGYYPVAWTNTKYKMVYFNMGHNDMDYEGGTNKELSYTFKNEIQNKCILNALLWLGNNTSAKP